MEKGVWYPILVRMGWMAVVAALLEAPHHLSVLGPLA